MKIAYQKHISRADLKANRSTLYVFGDNERRRGMGGQAKECRGEPNAVGIATKAAPSKTAGSFWKDADFIRCAAVIDDDMKCLFEHARKGGRIVLPAAGVGKGLAILPHRALRIMRHLQLRFEQLQLASSEAARPEENEHG